MWFDEFVFGVGGSFHLRARCHAKLGDWEACRSALREAHDLAPSLKLKSLDVPAFQAIFDTQGS